MDVAEQITKWRATADLDARAGEPVGKALREAASTVERLRQELAEANWLVGNYMAAAQMAERHRKQAEAADATTLRVRNLARRLELTRSPTNKACARAILDALREPAPAQATAAHTPGTAAERRDG